MAENKNYTDKIVKIQMRNLETNQDNYNVTITIKDLNKIIRDDIILFKNNFLKKNK